VRNVPGLKCQTSVRPFTLRFQTTVRYHLRGLQFRYTAGDTSHLSEAPPREIALPQTRGLPLRRRPLGCILLEFVNTDIAARSVGVGRGWRDVDLTDLD